jgi:hypothetical protein
VVEITGADNGASACQAVRLGLALSVGLLVHCAPACFTHADLKPLGPHELGHHHLGDDRIRLPHASAGACAGLVAAT